MVQEIGAGERKVRKAIEALKIEPTTFQIDRRVKYDSPKIFNGSRSGFSPNRQLGYGSAWT